LQIVSFNYLQQLLNLISLGLPANILVIHKFRYFWMNVDVMIAGDTRQLGSNAFAQVTAEHWRRRRRRQHDRKRCAARGPRIIPTHVLCASASRIGWAFPFLCILQALSLVERSPLLVSECHDSYSFWIKRLYQIVWEPP